VHRVVAFVNASAGSVDDDATAAVKAAFDAADPNLHVRVEAIDPAELQDRIRAEWKGSDRPDAIVVAGGDGTVSSAANAAAGTDIVVGVLPMGTFNHFAGDLGMPDEVAGAARSLVRGTVRTVDVGEVNGRVFVNNSLLGVYPKMVGIRDDVMAHHGWGKVRAVPLAVLHVLRRFPTHRVDLHGNGGFDRKRVRTPMLFVGNGIYESAPGSHPTRTSLDDGTLGVEVARTTTRLGLARSAVQALFRGSAGVDEIDRVSLTDLEVRSKDARLLVAIDGEVEWFSTPLRYRIRPGALHVLGPIAVGRS
jgi:diacylglycerol kinase family enzyme